MAASPSAAHTTNFSRAAATTLTFIKNNCWKKSSNGHEQYSRRREARQSLRRAADAAADAISQAVQGARRACDDARRGRHSSRARASLAFLEGHRQLLYAHAETSHSGEPGVARH